RHKGILASCVFPTLLLPPGKAAGSNFYGHSLRSEIKRIKSLSERLIRRERYLIVRDDGRQEEAEGAALSARDSRI
ncbi:hypothetical protein QQP08_024489, partial [Theobroma cacao]